MINCNDLIKYEGKYVKVGLPDAKDSNKLFFYYGTLIKANDDNILLSTKNKEFIIDASQIKLFAEHEEPDY